MNQALKKQQYIFCRNSIPKFNWATDVLSFLLNIQFQVTLQMDRHSFQHIS